MVAAVAHRPHLRWRRVRSCVVLIALGWMGWMQASTAGAAPPDPGLYTSAIYESEAAMLKGEGGTKHACMWKGRAKRQGKTICKSGLQLKCGGRGWYKTGPC